MEETRSSRSIVSDTLQSLTSQAKLWRDKIDLLEAGQQLGRAEAIADLGKLLDVCQNLRDAVLSEDSAATWKTKEELHALVDRLDDVASKRRRYLDLAQSLAGGTVSHRRERTKQERLGQRDAAVAELMEMSALVSPPDLPGPSVGEWLTWACSLEDGTDDPELLNLKSNFPRVDDFVRQLEIELWQDGPAPASHQMDESIPPAVPAPAEMNSGASSVEETTPEEERFSPHLPAQPPQDSAQDVSPDLEEASSIRIMEAHPAATEQQEQESPSPAPHSIASDRSSFFAADEVENFSRSIEEANRNPKKAGKVRALLAISHWLLPRNQNPLLHASCGMRAQIGYEGSSDLATVSPDEARKAIAADDGLLLLTGGADLLRWSLSQRSNEHSNAVASVRRLTLDQLRTWFVDLQKIALSESQIQDIYSLTSGIPLLVGEMHRVIIPLPEAPPTWVGFAIWTEMKSRFERRLSAVAQELRSGSPAVRLTDRELSLLKMVVIASDYSTPETIASNLMENWYEYHLPELPAMSSADENGVALLQGLGLLPMRHDSGLGPIQAITPLDPDDAVRQIVSHL